MDRLLKYFKTWKKNSNLKSLNVNEYKCSLDVIQLKLDICWFNERSNLLA